MQSSQDTRAKALAGDDRAEQLFTLQPSLARYDFTQQQSAACDEEIARVLATCESLVDPDPPLAPTDDSPSTTATQRTRLCSPHPSLPDHRCRPHTSAGSTSPHAPYRPRSGGPPSAYMADRHTLCLLVGTLSRAADAWRHSARARQS